MVESRSLMQLIEQVSSQAILNAPVLEDRGLAERLPFPFLEIVGQVEMKTASLLSIINPAVGGVLAAHRPARHCEKHDCALPGRLASECSSFVVSVRLLAGRR